MKPRQTLFFLAFAVLLAAGCAVTLKPGDARVFDDDVLYGKIREHERSLAVHPNARRRHNLDMMVLEMRRRYPGWEPGSGFPVRQEEARASLRSIPIRPEGCDVDRIARLNALGFDDEQIIKICEASVKTSGAEAPLGNRAPR